MREELAAGQLAGLSALITPSLLNLKLAIILSLGFFSAFGSLGGFSRSSFASDFLAAFNFGNERLAGFKARNVVLIDDERRVLRDVTGNFASPLLIYERAEAAHVNVVAFGHRILHYFEEGFNGRQNIGFLNASFLRNFGNYLSFGHVGKGVLKVKKKYQADNQPFPT